MPATYIYVSVKRLAQLTSEGEELGGVQSGGIWPGVVLRRGDTGLYVELVQFWLDGLALYDAALPAVAVDGSFGAATEAAVRAFQRQAGLSVDGVVGQASWEALFNAWADVQSDAGGTAYPGSPLRAGARGNAVRLLQLWLLVAASQYDLPTLTLDGIFGAGTTAAVRAFQALTGLAVDGVVGRDTWTRLQEVALAILNNLVEPGVLPGVFPGTLRPGDTGTGVRAVQYYLRLLAAYYAGLPAPAVDGVFGPATQDAVEAWQAEMGLVVDGIVGPATWRSLYDNAMRLAASGPVARLSPLPEPASVLRPGLRGETVATLRELLAFLAQWLPDLRPLPAGDTFDEETETALLAAQRTFALPQTGVVNTDDWLAFTAAAAALFAVTPGTAVPRPAGVWPGNALAAGSAGPAVHDLQGWLNEIAASWPGAAFLAETGFLDAATVEALDAFQRAAGLRPLGLVDDATWEAVKRAARRLPGAL